ENEILHHTEEYEAFYSLFVALAADALCSVSGSLSKTSLSQVGAASKVLLSFLLNRLETPNRACTVTPKYIMILISGMCQGGQCLSRSDVVTFTCLFKPCEVPPDLRVLEKEPRSKDAEKTKEKRLQRLDTQKDLFDQMTSVFADTPFPSISTIPSKTETSMDISEREPKTSMPSITQSPDTLENSSAIFIQNNIESLLGMNGAEILLKACTQLTFLSKYMQRYKDALSGTAFLLPGTLSQALTMRNGYQFLLTEVCDVWRAFSLPILEPLTPNRLRTIVEVTLGCLFAAMSVATADSVVNAVKPTGPSQASGAKDEEMDSQGHTIVQKTLEIFNWVSSAIKTSTRAGGSVAQNLNLLAAWESLEGLQGILALTPAIILERKDVKSKGSGDQKKEVSSSAPSSHSALGRPTSGKGSHPFLSVTAVALATHAIQLLIPLLEDLNIEGAEETISRLDPASSPGLEVDILDNLSAWGRVKALFQAIAVPDLAVQLMSTAFKKAVYLKRLKQGSDSQETISSSSTSDSNTFYEDDFSTSEGSSEEDDSEPILGQWLDEALSPYESNTTTPPPPQRPKVESLNGSDTKRQRETSVGSSSPKFVPDKMEPEGDCLVKQGLTATEATDLLDTASGMSNTSRYDVLLAMGYIKDQVAKLPLTLGNDISPKDLPGMSDILILDAMLAKCQVSLDDTYTKAMTDPSPNKAMAFCQDLLPAVLVLIKAFNAFARSCVLNKVCGPDDKSLTSQRMQAFGQVLSIGSSHPNAVKGLGTSLVGLLPSTVRNTVDRWNSSGGNEFPSMGAWVCGIMRTMALD
ncbi:E3 ubiquitin-protein ligase ubr4, partial [Plakobranchus ocellatus]